jgi:hemerythrin-like domain-containing protein
VLTAHHSIEDASVFPHLRAAEPELAPVLDKLSADHHVVHALLEELDRALVAMLGGGDLATVRASVEELQRVLVAHLDFEERELVGPLDRLGYY